jgi:hypothetical protein
MGREFFSVAGGLLVVQPVLLASRSYVVREALVFVAFTALLVFVGTIFLLLAILFQEVGRWSLRWIKDASLLSHPGRLMGTADSEGTAVEGAPVK